jgi:hypothetical protein
MIGVGPPFPDLLEDHAPSLDEPRKSCREVIPSSRGSNPVSQGDPASPGASAPLRVPVGKNTGIVPVRNRCLRWLFGVIMQRHLFSRFFRIIAPYLGCDDDGETQRRSWSQGSKMQNSSTWCPGAGQGGTASDLP